MRYRPEIDGLRTIAVLPVLLFHAHVAGFSGGFLGVDVFFVISGFLITSILLSDLKEGRYCLRTFYERRARRILPALVFMILCVTPVAWLFLLPLDLADFGRSIAATMGFASNILFWRESGYFDTAAEFKPLLHTWSLAVEEQYYIFFPPLLALLFARSRRMLWILLALCALLSLALAQIGSGISASASFYLFPTRAWELLVGALAALAVFDERLQLTGAPAQGLSLLGLAAILSSIVLLDKSVPFPGVYALPATLGTVLVLLFARPGTWVQRVLAFRPIVALGLISYSTYLWHQPLIALYRYRFPEYEAGTVLIALLALPLAWLSWRFVEAPFRNKSILPERTSYLTATLAVIIGLALGGLALTAKGGWSSRYTEKENTIFNDFAAGKAYVPERFNALRGAEFSTRSERRKVLIIGDSYGQDLVNALAEAGLVAQLDLSTHHIAGRCGNLMLKDLAQYQKPADRAYCSRNQGYHLPTLRARLEAADEIWLVSFWNTWTAPLLPASLNQIAASTQTPVTVFGIKHFGPRAAQNYHAGGLSALTTLKPVPADLVQIQQEMARTIPPLARYIDLQMLLCGRYDACTNQDASGRLLSFDGTHLTPNGALYVGTKLVQTLGLRAP
jgi:peptidoglycan/LPS O-acetylase OafA/YrhL